MEPKSCLTFSERDCDPGAQPGPSVKSVCSCNDVPDGLLGRLVVVVETLQPPVVVKRLQFHARGGRKSCLPDIQLLYLALSLLPQVE